MTERATIRRALEDDLEAIESILLAHDTPPSGEPAFPPGAYHRYLRHLLARGTVVVAHAGPSIIGFGASIKTGPAIHLADLFVEPSRHGQGIGQRLLAAVKGDAWPRTTFASDDPRALPLYVRHRVALTTAERTAGAVL